MDIRFISLIDRNKIKLESVNGIFEEVSINEESKRFKYYFIIQGKKVEVIFLTSIYDVKKYYNKEVKKNIILVEEVNINNYKYLNMTNSIILTAKKEECCVKAVILNKLINCEKIDLSLLSLFMINDENYNRIKENINNLLLIIGQCTKEQIVSDIVINTLKEINLLQNANYLELFIYTNQELDLRCLANIEDPLKDYINYTKLKIKQSMFLEQEENCYYYLLSKSEG